MTTPLSQIPKPQAAHYAAGRKLFLVPIYLFPADLPDDAKCLLERYWSDVRDHIQNLERALGGAAHVFHEAIYAGADEGLAMIEALNPFGSGFVQALCRGGAALQPTEDGALVAEHSDWQRCLSIGLLSEKVMELAMAGVQETAQKRFDHIAARISECLSDGEAGVLFISEGHRVQFAADIQVFFVAPPSQDALKRWLDNQMRAYASAEQGAQSSESEGA